MPYSSRYMIPLLEMLIVYSVISYVLWKSTNSFQSQADDDDVRDTQVIRLENMGASRRKHDTNGTTNKHGMIKAANANHSLKNHQSPDKQQIPNDCTQSTLATPIYSPRKHRYSVSLQRGGYTKQLQTTFMKNGTKSFRQSYFTASLKNSTPSSGVKEKQNISRREYFSDNAEIEAYVREDSSGRRQNCCTSCLCMKRCASSTELIDKKGSVKVLTQSTSSDMSLRHHAELEEKDASSECNSYLSAQDQVTYCYSNTNMNTVRKTDTGEASRGSVTSRRGCPPRRTSSYARRSRRKVVRLLIIIFVNFAVCVAPHHVRQLMHYWNIYPGNSYSVTFFPPLAFISLYFHSAINPVFYCIFSDSFRRSLIVFLRRVFCRR